MERRRTLGRMLVGTVMAVMLLSVGVVDAQPPADTPRGIPARLERLEHDLGRSDRLPSPPFDRQMQPAVGGTTEGTSVTYYGLLGATGSYDQTWVWNGVTRSWSNVESAIQPGERFGAAAAASPTTPGTLLYGGCTQSSGCPMDIDVDQDTWVFDGSIWTELCEQCAPGVRLGHMMASNGENTLLFGGLADSQVGLIAHNDLWSFSGRDWEPVDVAGTPPPARFDAGFSWDGERFILFGGSGAELYGDTWALSDETGRWTWTKLCDDPECGPSAREVFAFAGLTTDQRPFATGAVLVGGAGVGGWVSDVWYWNGTTQRWRLIDAVAPPTENPTQPGVFYLPLAGSMPGIPAAVITVGTYVPATDSFETHTAQVDGARNLSGTALKKDLRGPTG